MFPSQHRRLRNEALALSCEDVRRPPRILGKGHLRVVGVGARRVLQPAPQIPACPPPPIPHRAEQPAPVQNLRPHKVVAGGRVVIQPGRVQRLSQPVVPAPAQVGNDHMLMHLRVAVPTSRLQHPRSQQPVCRYRCRSVRRPGCRPVRRPVRGPVRRSGCRPVRRSGCRPVRRSGCRSGCRSVCRSVCGYRCGSVCWGGRCVDVGGPAGAGGWGGSGHANSALWPMRYHPDVYRRCYQRLCDQTLGGREEPKRRLSVASSGVSPERSTGC